MRTKGSRNQEKSDQRLSSYYHRHGYRGGHENRGWKFTPEHWKQWLEMRTAEPDGQVISLRAGIAEFRSLLNK